MDLTSIQAILGVDPGSSSGAFSLYSMNPESETAAVETCNMPGSMSDILTFLRAVRATYKNNVHAVVENVGGSRPGNSSKSARTFSEHVGALKMALIAAEIGSTWVQPRKWMVGACGMSVPKGSTSAEVKKRKDYIYAALQVKYPDVKFTKRQSDAVGIMHYGRLLVAEGKLI